MPNVSGLISSVSFLPCYPSDPSCRGKRLHIILKAEMLVYAYFAKRRGRKESEVEAQHHGPAEDNTPRLVISDHTDDSSGEKSPTSPANDPLSPGATLAPTRTQPGPGLTPLTSHNSSNTKAHHAEHPDVERRARHKYTIRRPRALQYSYHSQIITAGDEAGVLQSSNEHGEHHGHAEKSDISSHLPEAVAKQRERLDLFVDLIWVGIIGNLSEVFSALNFAPHASHPGLATLVFLMVFLPSWRIWNSMREFLNNYYMDDMVQRIFTFWILVLSVFYGNQIAYLAEDIDGMKVWVISLYLLIHGSFLLIEEVYSIFIPWLRTLVFLQLVIRLPSIGLWIAGIYLQGAKAIGPIFAAIIWEYCCPLLLDSPLGERFTPGEYRKALDVNHFSSRMANFFIIVLGEGVLQLITNGPLGKGINGLTGEMVWVLSIYFTFTFLYFARDGSKTYLPAVRHKGWKFLIFVFFHIPLFSSLLTFVASVMFILRHQGEQNYQQQQDQEPLTKAEISSDIANAVWTCASSLTIIVFCMLGLALLDQPLDKPGTLRVQNRYIRLAGRPLYMIVIMLLPIKSHLDPTVFLAVACFGLLLVTVWEWNSCLEREGSFIEPRGLTHMVSHELKGKHVALAHGTSEDHHPHRKFDIGRAMI